VTYVPLTDDTVRELDALNMIEAAAAGDRDALAQTVLLYHHNGEAARLAASVALVAALTLVSGHQPRAVLTRFRHCLLNDRKETTP
jgi:hypothetical protein